MEQQFKAAVAAYDAGQFAGAAAGLEGLLARAPNSFEIHELLGLAYAAQAERTEAVAQFEIAVRLRPELASARTNLAMGLAQAGKPAQAQEQCRKALDIDPRDYTANHNLAELYLQADQVPRAIPLLEQARASRPAAYNNTYDLALAYLLTGRLEEARKLVEPLLAEKDSGELHTLLGRIDEKQARFIDAANEFATAAHLDPSEDNLFAWATELLLHRTYEPAIAVFQQGTERYPRSPRLWIGLGMALYSRGEYERSIQSLLAAADLDPDDPRCYLFLSKAYLSSPTQTEAVIARFRRYAEDKPDNALASYYYAMGLWKGRRLEDPNVDYHAIGLLLEKAIALDGSLADAHLQLGILYNDQRAYGKALPEYEQALQLNPNLPDAHYRMGQYYAHIGEKAKAQGEFDLFKKLQTQHQADLDKERADVQQFVVAARVTPDVPKH